MWGEIVEVGNGHVFVVLGAHVKRVFDSYQWFPLQCKLCMNINDVYHGKMPLCSHLLFS